MSFYQNTDCPVCHKQFCEDDTIVTCPVCGTPHHKECYDEIGHCVNHNLHKAGYDYIKEHKNPSQSAGSVFNANQEYYQPPQQSADKSDNENEETTQPTPNPFNILGANTVATPFDKDKGTIGGKPVAEVAVGVGVNAHKFIKIFKTLENGSKKFVWNWCAFFFGPFYFFARKMYKHGIALLCLIYATLFTGMGCINKFAPTYISFINDMMAQTNPEAIDTKKLEMIMQSQEGAIAGIIVYAMIGIFLAISIFSGLFANRIYKSTIIKNINSVEKMIEEGKQLQSPIIYSTINAPTQDDLKKLQIARKGGLSFFAPVLAYICIEMLFMMITYML